MDTPPREISRRRWDGQPLAEAHADGTWSDYIFANGKRIARADNYETVLHMSGVNAQSCSREYFSLGIIALSPYTHVVQAGDILNFRQYQTGPGTIGGLALYFSNNDISYFHSVPDTDGQDLGADATMNAWHYRTVDLSQFAGESLGSVRLINTGGAPPGQFDLYFDDIAVTSPDGTVLPVFSKTPGVGVEGGVAGPAECVSNLAVTDETSGSSSVAALAPKDTTTYYHGDQIGSARLLTVGGGWAVWSGTYTPYGQEINPAQINPPNFYKFTGKERDEEEGSYLDYFGARYYASTMGRFLTPDFQDDESDPEPVPWADFANPQSLNQYSYVYNNPLSHADRDGHDVNVCTSDTFGNQQCSLISNNEYNAAQQAGNGSLNVPTLDQVGMNGSGNITDANGNTVGTATYVPDSGVDFYGNQAAYNTLGAAGRVVNALGTAEFNALGFVMPEMLADTAIEGGLAGGAKLGEAAANRINHVFQAKHGLDALVQQFGSKQAAYEALASAAEKAVAGTAGPFQTTVQVGGQSVVVRGAVIDGAIKISTAFKP